MGTDTEFSHEAFAALLKLLKRYGTGIDSSGVYEVLWHDEGVHVEINDSDLFAWGYSGAVELAPGELQDLERAYEDARAASPTFGTIWAPHLFIARKLGQRPQGAAYPSEQALWPLFDACGPKRETGFGNPYEPGEYQSWKRRRHAADNERGDEREKHLQWWLEHCPPRQAWMRRVLGEETELGREELVQRCLDEGVSSAELSAGYETQRELMKEIIATRTRADVIRSAIGCEPVKCWASRIREHDGTWRVMLRSHGDEEHEVALTLHRLLHVFETSRMEIEKKCPERGVWLEPKHAQVHQDPESCLVDAMIATRLDPAVYERTCMTVERAKLREPGQRLAERTREHLMGMKELAEEAWKIVRQYTRTSPAAGPAQALADLDRCRVTAVRMNGGVGAKG